MITEKQVKRALECLEKCDYGIHCKNLKEHADKNPWLELKNEISFSADDPFHCASIGITCLTKELNNQEIGE